jgi:hypothetical protein
MVRQLGEESFKMNLPLFSLVDYRFRRIFLRVSCLGFSGTLGTPQRGVPSLESAPRSSLASLGTPCPLVAFTSLEIPANPPAKKYKRFCYVKTVRSILINGLARLLNFRVFAGARGSKTLKLT